MRLQDDQLRICEGNCLHYFRNVWIAAAIDAFTLKLAQLLEHDLAIIPSHLRVNTSMENLLRAIDKEFNLTANYPKGKGDMFHDWWMEKYYPGELLMPVVRTLGGARQDLAIEGAPAVYMNHKFYVSFLHERLSNKLTDNILEHNIFIILESVEMIALLHICSILYGYLSANKMASGKDT